jgi:D-aminoacyl-tRNA deacylase
MFASMRAVIQRVSSASVAVNNIQITRIEQGLLVLIGFETTDEQVDIDWLTQKIVQLRIFADPKNNMNLSLLDVVGSLLLVSQFTLHASCKKGNRPSFLQAAKPEIAIPIYNKTIEAFNKLLSSPISTGIFGADMQVDLCNDGPVTVILDSKNKDLF